MRAVQQLLSVSLAFLVLLDGLLTRELLLRGLVAEANPLLSDGRFWLVKVSAVPCVLLIGQRDHWLARAGLMFCLTVYSLIVISQLVALYLS
jgi:hypothetical protein